MKILNFILAVIFLCGAIFLTEKPFAQNGIVTNPAPVTVESAHMEIEKPLILNSLPVPVLDCERANDGLVLQMRPGKMKLQVCRDDIIHIVYTPSQSFPTRKSLMVANDDWTPVNWNFKKIKTRIRITTAKIRLNVSIETGAVSYYDTKDNIILQDLPSGGRILIPAEVVGESTFHAENKFISQKDEAYYGLGQHQNGVINYKGQKIILTQDNTIIANPFLVSNKGYGILWDNYSQTVFQSDTSTNTSSLWSEVADAIDYYFIYGPDVDNVLSGYRQITGQVPMFGKWAYGLWQSKERYKTQEELLDVVKEYRTRKIPLDNIVQDWQYWDKIGSHSFDQERYPDPESMIRDVQEKYNAHFMISVWPKFSRETDNFKELNEKGYFYGYRNRLPFYDAFSADARRIYWDQINKNLFSKGIDAWWLDGTEPELMYPINADTIKVIMNNALGTGARYLNAYSLMTSKAVYDGQRSVNSDKRVFILTRSAYAGQQRYASASWSGDIEAIWDVFKAQIPAGLNFCVSGIPYWCADIGAFFVNNYPEGCNNQEYRELYTRWFQYGSFCPIFRVHGTATPRELWQFGPEAEKILVTYDNLRYRLMPYIYSLAWRVTDQGYTMMRALVMDFRTDAAVCNINDQFMFGDAFLVNPVTEPKADHRNLYLPGSSDWYDFWNGNLIKGGQNIDALAPIAKMPLYIKAGSIVPMGPFLQYATEKPADPIELRIYRGSNAKFVLYEDENDNYNYEKGAYTKIPITWDEKKQKLTIGDRQGSFPGMLHTRIFSIVWVKENHGVGVDLTEKPDKTVMYDGKSITI